MTTPAAGGDGQFLRTLAPLLRSLSGRVREWLDARRRYPVAAIARAEVEGLAEDLRRKAEDLDVERPVLVVMLMGGTGVGKSTLMNALAGAPVAQASYTRPTTRDPVVYFHHTVNPDRLDPALRLCRLSRHDREELRDKVIVDTPDLDSNDIANRDRLLELLPVADVVLYVGSQEKYHDQIGWEVFKEQRRRRAFAFVLNKWDRCLEEGAPGLRPDVDLLKDLADEGFANPRLFRTSAQLWVESKGETPPSLPPGEQFAELREWLELGLTRLEIDAVKARGVGQLVKQVEQSFEAVKPPDLVPVAARVEAAWTRTLAAEAEAQAEVLAGTLEPFQNEVELHFSRRGHQRFRGLMAGYLRLTDKVRYLGSSFRDRVPFAGKLRGGKSDASSEWDLAGFVRSCARSASERALDQRLAALASRLQVEASQAGYPLGVLGDRARDTLKLDWEDRVTRVVVDALTETEAEVVKPTGIRKAVRDVVGFMGNFVPETVLILSIVVLMWRYFVEGLSPEFFHVLLPFYITLGALIVLHVLILFALPVRWSAIRDEFAERLQTKLRAEFERTYLPIPTDGAKAVAAERESAEQLQKAAWEVAEWLGEREHAANVGDLYGR
jgi:energy-coupling factor transporter ATP-binding protein EcfA2